LAAVVVALGLAFAVSGPVQAQGGIAIYPSAIELKDAVRGEEYVRTVTVLNEEQNKVTFGFKGDGEVGGWLSLHPQDDPTTTLDRIDVPAGGQTRVLVRVAVPADAPNGPHQGSLGLQSVVGAAEGEGSASSVSMGLSVDMEVDVTGVERLSGAVLDLATNDIEVGQPLEIRTTFNNTGNVRAQPQIRLQVKDATGAVVGEASYADTAVEAGSSQVIRSEWDATGRGAGDYVASVTVSLGDKQLDARELEFKILPRGTLPHSESTDEGLPLWAWMLIGAGAVVGAVVIVGGSWALARRLLRSFRL
jgi:hypothetical protein